MREALGLPQSQYQILEQHLTTCNGQTLPYLPQCTNNRITTLYIKPVLMKNHSFGASLLRIPNSETDHHNCGHPQFCSFLQANIVFFFIIYHSSYGIGAFGKASFSEIETNKLLIKNYLARQQISSGSSVRELSDKSRWVNANNCNKSVGNFRSALPERWRDLSFGNRVSIFRFPSLSRLRPKCSS